MTNVITAGRETPVSGGLVVADQRNDRRAMRADFVQTLDWILKERGLSQRRFVADIGLSSHTEITRWRTLGYEPRPDVVFTIEEYFDLAPGTLSRTLGYLPVSARSIPLDVSDFEEMVRSHQLLPPWGKEILLVSYREIMGSLGRRQQRSSHRS